MSSARVIVVANEKGGSGKSTVAMHVAIALIKSGQRVATIDLDARQRSFTRFIENRRAWARQVARDLEIPDHFSFGNVHRPTAEHEAAGCKVLTDAVNALGRRCGVIVIDTPGHDNYLMRLAHSLADTLITPLNDSLSISMYSAASIPGPSKLSGPATTRRWCRARAANANSIPRPRNGLFCATGFRR
jgi:chromosome partitioning protein